MTILCYHSVDPRWRSPLSLPPAEFAAQCEQLHRGRRVVDLSERLEKGRGSGLRGRIALTFDDGFAELAEHVFPLLARHRLPAVVFLVAQTLTPQGQAVDWVDTAPEWPLQTLTLAQVLEARDAGIRFASHSWRHADLTTLSEEECTSDLRESRELLEELLQEPVPWLAYPRGRHAAHVRRAAERAGYSHAFSLPEAKEHVGAYAVPRVGVFPGNARWGLTVKTAPGYLGVRHSPVFPALRGAARSLSRRPRTGPCC